MIPTVEAGAPSAAVNADNEASSSSDDEDDDRAAVSRAKRNDAELRVELPVDPPASLAAMETFCSSANPLWKAMGWTPTDPLPHKSLAKNAPATRLRLATDYKARLETMDRHGRDVGVIRHTGAPDGAQSGVVVVLPQGREANLWWWWWPACHVHGGGYGESSPPRLDFDRECGDGKSRRRPRSRPRRPALRRRSQRSPPRFRSSHPSRRLNPLQGRVSDSRVGARLHAERR